MPTPFGKTLSASVPYIHGSCRRLLSKRTGQGLPKLRIRNAFVRPRPVGGSATTHLHHRGKVRGRPSIGHDHVPTVIVTAIGGRKILLASMLITDIRAHRGNVKVRVMDYRHSFKPICRLFGGRHIEFTEEDPRPINIWNYPGIENGTLPTKRQLAMVLTDILILSKTPKADAILRHRIHRHRRGLQNGFMRNVILRSSLLLTLPRHLKSYTEFNRGEAGQRVYLGQHHRKDAAQCTHPSGVRRGFDVRCLRVRISAWTRRSGRSGVIASPDLQEIGEENEQNQKTPILFLCDEMREINRHFPAIQELIAEATVTGRKEGLVTILFSQAYEHFTGTPEQPNVTGIDLVKNSGVKMIGKQIGGFERLADDCELAPETIFLYLR